MKKILLLLVTCSFLSSCSSIFYTNRVQNNTFSITTNIDNYRVSFPKAQDESYVSNGKQFSYTLPKLRSRYTTIEISKENYETQKIKLKKTVRAVPLLLDVVALPFTFGIPIFIDLFKSDFYKLKNISQNVNINLVNTQAYMSSQFNNIKSSKNSDVLNKFIIDYPYFNGINDAVNLRDSLELISAINSREEERIRQFIQTRTTSKFIPEATKIEAGFVESRVKFEKIKQENTIEAVENFIKTYPSSVQIEDAHRLLIKISEKKAVESGNSLDLIVFYNNYLIPNQQYLSNLDYSKKKLDIKSLASEYIENELKGKDYTYHINHYSKYLLIDKKYIEVKDLVDFSDVYKKQLSDNLFSELLGIKSITEQTSLQNKISHDFPDLYNEQDIFLNILEKSSNKKGKVTIFNLDYSSIEFAKNANKYKNVPSPSFVYKDKTIKLNQNQITQILNFDQNHLDGIQEIYTKDGYSHKINISGYKVIGEDFYLNKSKIGSNYFDLDGSFLYKYEFENGINLTLRDLDEEIKSYDNWVKSKDFYEALEGYKGLKQNKYPNDLAQNILLAKKIKECQLLISQKEADDERKQLAEKARQEKIRLAEERKQESIRIAEEKKQELIRLAEEKKKQKERLAERKKTTNNSSSMNQDSYPSIKSMDISGLYVNSAVNYIRLDRNGTGLMRIGGEALSFTWTFNSSMETVSINSEPTQRSPSIYLTFYMKLTQSRSDLEGKELVMIYYDGLTPIRYTRN